MAGFSELSMLELNAERGELLPEREALQTITTTTSNETTVTSAITVTQAATGANDTQSAMLSLLIPAGNG